jgi:PPOX class probable F420-dependent enzyme
VGEPEAGRPYRPGYGIEPAREGRGLLPWSWATRRLAASHDYWVATVRPGGGPHVMPVWGVWHDTSVWFSSGGRSRKARNLRAEPRCVVTTDNPREPVVLEGRAELVTDPDLLAVVLDLENRKYRTAYTMDLLDPAVNACFRVRPDRAFGIAEGRFTTSPTRWVFS